MDGRGGVEGGHALAAMPCMRRNAGPGREPGESGQHRPGDCGALISICKLGRPGRRHTAVISPGWRLAIVCGEGVIIVIIVKMTRHYSPPSPQPPPGEIVNMTNVMLPPAILLPYPVL